jgi:flagellar biogenesis protein FliO
MKMRGEEKGIFVVEWNETVGMGMVFPLSFVFSGLSLILFLVSGLIGALKMFWMPVLRETWRESRTR